MITCSFRRITAALNLPDGASPPTTAFWVLAGFWDVMFNRTYEYRGDDKGDVVVNGGGILHPAVQIATTYLRLDPAKWGGRGGL